MKKLIDRCLCEGEDKDLQKELQLICQVFEESKCLLSALASYLGLGGSVQERHKIDSQREHATMLAYFESLRTFLKTESSLTNLRKERYPQEGMSTDPLIALKYVGFRFVDPVNTDIRDGLELVVGDFASDFKSAMDEFRTVTMGYENRSWRADVSDTCSIDELLNAAKSTIANVDSTVLDKQLAYMKSVPRIVIYLRTKDK